MDNHNSGNGNGMINEYDIDGGPTMTYDDNDDDTMIPNDGAITNGNGSEKPSRASSASSRASLIWQRAFEYPLYDDGEPYNHHDGSNGNVSRPVTRGASSLKRVVSSSSSPSRALKEIHHLERLIESQPNDVNHYLNLARLLNICGERRRCIRILLLAQKRHPRETNVQTLLNAYGYVPRQKRAPVSTPSPMSLAAAAARVPPSRNKHRTNAHTTASNSNGHGNGNHQSRSLPSSVRPSARHPLAPLSRAPARALSAGATTGNSHGHHTHGHDHHNGTTLNGSSSAPSLPLVITPPPMPLSSPSQSPPNDHHIPPALAPAAIHSGTRSPLPRAAYHHSRMMPLPLPPSTAATISVPSSSIHTNVDPFTTISEALTWPHISSSSSSLPPLPVWNAAPITGDLPISARKPRDGMVVFIDRNGTAAPLATSNHTNRGHHGHGHDSISLSSSDTNSRSVTPLPSAPPVTTSSSTRSGGGTGVPSINVNSSSSSNGLLFFPSTPPLVSMSPGGTPLPATRAWPRSPNYTTRASASGNGGVASSSNQLLSPISPPQSQRDRSVSPLGHTSAIVNGNSHSNGNGGASSSSVSNSPLLSSLAILNVRAMPLSPLTLSATSNWNGDTDDMAMARATEEVEAAAASRQLRSTVDASLSAARTIMTAATNQEAYHAQLDRQQRHVSAAVAYTTSVRHRAAIMTVEETYSGGHGSEYDLEGFTAYHTHDSAIIAAAAAAALHDERAADEARNGARLHQHQASPPVATHVIHTTA